MKKRGEEDLDNKYIGTKFPWFAKSFATAAVMHWQKNLSTFHKKSLWMEIFLNLAITMLIKIFLKHSLNNPSCFRSLFPSSFSLLFEMLGKPNIYPQ